MDQTSPDDSKRTDLPAKDPGDLEAVIRRLQARLDEAEDQIRTLNESQRRMGLLLDALRTNSESSEYMQTRLEAEVARQRGELRRNTARVDDILASRIWRTLVSAGALALRLRRKPAPAAMVRENISAEETAPVKPIRWAVASRHARGSGTLEEWVEVLRRCVAARTRAEAPRISIITPAWNTQISWFAEAAVSVLEQTTGAWEWVIVDDKSSGTAFHGLFPVLQETGQVKVVKAAKKLGISEATNEGLRIASGEYVCFLDHDDLLAPGALAACLEALEGGLDAVYTDSDKVDEAGLRRDAFHKPEWSPEYMRGVMYVGHLLCVRRDMALATGGFKSQFDGLQDYEFFLRYSERTERIGHISEVLYHWRAVRQSVAASTHAKGNLGPLQCAAVQEHLDRMNLPGVAEEGPIPHRLVIVPKPLRERPKVSIIIPTKNAPELLERCLTSVFEKSSYPNFEVVCVDNETTDSQALRLMRSHGVKHVPFPGKFNFSRANNLGVRAASGEVLVLMNNDVEVIARTWMEDMLYYALQDDVGAVGGLLVYEDHTVQHAGVVLGCRGTADHLSRNVPADSDGYAGSLCCAHEVSAVTAACLMLTRKKFELAGGFNEYYHTAYQDVDFCLELRSKGLRNIFTPRARFFHLESRSRGKYYDFIDRNLLLDRWGSTIAEADPYYNPNLDVEAANYSVKAN